MSNLRHKTIKGGALLTAGQMFSQGCSFLRNVIIARLLTPADFGIAATFSMTLAFIEMISGIATDKLIIQSPDGDDEKFQSNLHLIQFARGLLNGTILLGIASPMATLFGVPEAKWAFQCISIVPVLRGLLHQDINRFQRKLKFLPFVVSESLSVGIVCLLAYPMGKLVGDYAVMLYIVILQSLIMMIASHFFSDRTYKWGYNKQYIEQVSRFGWPLLINGILLYGIMQGDQLLIGSSNKVFHINTFSLSDLGVYSICFSLTFAPTMIVSNISTSLFLPILSNSRKDIELFYARYSFLCETIALIAGIIAIIMIISGEPIVRLIYGAKYVQSSHLLVAWLSCMQCLRIIRMGPTIAAMSYGDTKNAMFSNMFRSSTFLLSILSVLSGRGVTSIAVCAFIGELIAFIACTVRLKRVHKINRNVSIYPMIVVLAFMLICGIFKYFYKYQLELGSSLLYSIFICTIFILVAAIIFKSLRFESYKLYTSAATKTL
jgi:O-antigen/teichoic acid export membrane protein